MCLSESPIQTPKLLVGCFPCVPLLSLFLFLAHRHVVIKLHTEQRSEHYFIILRNHFFFDEHMISMNTPGKRFQRARDAGGISPATVAKKYKAGNKPHYSAHIMFL